MKEPAAVGVPESAQPEERTTPGGRPMDEKHTTGTLGFLGVMKSVSLTGVPTERLLVAVEPLNNEKQLESCEERPGQSHSRGAAGLSREPGAAGKEVEDSAAGWATAAAGWAAAEMAAAG